MPRKQPDTRTFFEQEIDRIYNGIPFRPTQFAQVRQSKILMETHFAETVDLDALASANQIRHGRVTSFLFEKW